jgi:Ca2+-binding RTX toxin-like protein
VGLPSWLNFDETAVAFHGTPDRKVNGIWRVAVTATDGAGAEATTDFSLIIYAQAGAVVTGTGNDDVMYGGAGNEVLVGKGGDDALFGGAGDDVIHAGSGADVILFNRGDGTDTVFADRAGDNTLSFGGGIRYSDLSLSRSGQDLIVSAGDNDRVVLKSWYAGQSSVSSLQIVLDDDYDAGSEDPLHNRSVQRFDFLGMVGAFDLTRHPSPGLTSWHVTNALLQFHLSGADDAALSGDLAYWFARNRAVAGLSVSAAQEIIGASGFGADAQSLRPFGGLREGFARLS